MNADQEELAWLARMRPSEEAMLSLLSGSEAAKVEICNHGIPWGECDECSDDPEAAVTLEDGMLVEFVLVASVLRPNGLRANKALTAPGQPPHSTRGLLLNAAEAFTG